MAPTATRTAHYRAQLRTNRRQCHYGYSLLLCFAVIMSAFMSVSAFVPRHVHNEATPARSNGRSRVLPQSSALFVAKTGGKVIASSADYTEFVVSADASRPVMCFYTAPWCGPCRLSVPVVKEVMKQFAGQIDVVELCTDDLPEVAADSGVESIPTIQMFYKGQLMDTIVGCVAKSVLASAVDKVLEDATLISGAGEEPNGKAP